MPPVLKSQKVIVQNTQDKRHCLALSDYIVTWAHYTRNVNIGDAMTWSGTTIPYAQVRTSAHAVSKESVHYQHYEP